MHERLRTHAESVAFFGGGSREREVLDLLPLDLAINLLGLSFNK